MYGAEHPLTLTTTIDISHTGVKFRAAQQLPPGSEIEVRILADPSDPENGWIETRAKVVRSETDKMSASFERFLGGSEANLTALLEQLEASIEHPEA